METGRYLSKEEWAKLAKRREDLKKERERVQKMKFEAETFAAVYGLEELKSRATNDPYYQELLGHEIARIERVKDYKKRDEETLKRVTEARKNSPPRPEWTKGWDKIWIKEFDDEVKQWQKDCEEYDKKYPDTKDTRALWVQKKYPVTIN